MSYTGQFVELGTAHVCAGALNYWYWGYSSIGPGGTINWRPLGTQFDIRIGDTHTFQIKRSNGSWNYIVDRDTKGSVYLPNTVGQHVDIGLESYSPSGVVPSYNHTLLFNWNEQGWYYFDGQDQSLVNSQMCGRWVSSSSWQAAENTSC